MWSNNAEEAIEKPQVRSGWGAAGGGGAITSNMGMAQKSAAANYWDAKTEEIIIPEMMDGDAPQEVCTIVAEPPSVDHKMTNLRELNKDFALNVPSATPDGSDISLLTSVIRPIADLIETDMQWDYLGLQAEIGQNYREKYGDGLEGKTLIGAKASGH